MTDIGPIPSADLTELVRALLLATGVVDREARFISSHVVDAEERDNRSQGLVRVPPYVRWARAGEIASPTRVTVERHAGATLVLDAHNGWGHVAAADAMERCLDGARRNGVCLAMIRTPTIPAVSARMSRRRPRTE